LFSIIIYTLSYVNGEVSFFTNSFKSDKMESKVIQVAVSLLNPHSKYTIVDEWPVINHNKMLILNTTCNDAVSGYPQLLTDLELHEIDPLGGIHNIHMKIKATEFANPDNIIIECGRLPIDLSDRPMVYEIKRIGIDSDSKNPVELKIWIW